jgi:hypothetical protein
VGVGCGEVLSEGCTVGWRQRKGSVLDASG